MNWIKKIQTIAIIFLIPLSTIAQYDSIVNSLKAEFENFKNKSIEQHNNFITKNDSIFIAFLNKAWKDVELLTFIKTELPKPKNQPIITSDSTDLKLDYIIPKTIHSVKKENNEDVKLKISAPERYNSRAVVNSFNFYGNKGSIYYSPQLKPKLLNVSEKDIVRFYTALSSNSNIWEYTLNQLYHAKQEYALNDWGYYQLLKKAAEIIFETPNEQRLFCWYLLLKSGYNTRVGYNKNEVFLLVPSINKLYNVPYFKDFQETYYITDYLGSAIDNIKTYDTNHPECSNSFSFDLNNFPKLEGDSLKRTLIYNGQSISLKFNRNIQRFLDSYPHCELGIYFQTKLSANISKELNHLFIPLLNGKSDREKVNELLDFCQHALAYKTDQEQFGKERYLFATESLYYPFNDCEDRTVLLASLIDQYIGLDMIALDFPGHVLLAVNFKDEGNGTYITYSNKKYLVCDPTYINAKCGMMPEDLKNFKPEIIDFNK